jgi:two-component system response regulator HydG
MEEQMRLPTCDEPFERGPKLCGICRLATENEALGRCSRMVVESEAMRRLLLRTAPIARTSAPVVILGESGTGKEVLARALHANGPRKSRPFVAVNVAALPSELLESELFGHAKGAFTGAVAARQGLMEAADGGTLFLDEIGEMPVALQAKLLRALQDGEVRPVGGTKAFRVNVRVVCATHRDLAALVASGAFREDLYYRLKVFVLRVPPLRERVADIVPLARMFLEREGSSAALGTRAIARLERYAWPGNVRELQNAMTHAAALCGATEIDLPHLPEELNSRAPMKPVAGLQSLARVEQEHVMRVLEACGGNQQEAARILEIGRNTLWRKLRAWTPERSGQEATARR